MIKSWRTVSSFTHSDRERSVRVEGRVHFELAESREEAEARTREYLQSWDYKDIVITDVHEETGEEKYGKGHPFANMPVENIESVEVKHEETKVQEIEETFVDDGELF